MKCALILTLLFLGNNTASADIYRYVNEDGIECFTDSPQDSKAVIIMKEAKHTRKFTSPAPIIPRHLEATGIAARLGTGQPEIEDVGLREQRVLPVMGRITSIAGLRQDPFDGKLRHHNGVDIAIPSGTPIKPVADGVIVFSGIRPGYGNMVVVEHPNGIITLYAHNSVNLVREGDQVAKMTVIALTGSTGRSTGPHLHFEAWQNGTNITPTYMPGATGNVTVARVARPADQIRRTVQADGTIRFTNMD